MKPFNIIASLGAAAILGLSVTTASAMTFETDKLSVSISDQAVAGSNATYTGLWVGEVERNGKTVTWVEITDRYGEVVYEGVINANETHLLPDGHALTVRNRVEDTKKSVKIYTDRVAPDVVRVATQRIVVDPVTDVQKQSHRVTTPTEDEPSGGFVAMTQRYVSDAVKLMKATVRGVRIAWL